MKICISLKTSGQSLCSDLGDVQASSSSLAMSQVNKSKRKQPRQYLTNARDWLSLSLSISGGQATLEPASLTRRDVTTFLFTLVSHLVPDCPISTFVDWCGLKQKGAGEMIPSVKNCHEDL